MSAIEEKIKNKTIEQLRPRTSEVLMPEDLAPYYFKRLKRKWEINDAIDELREEYDALSRL